MPQITITAGSITLPATLNDSPTSQQLWQALPIEGSANIWGDEIYFRSSVTRICPVCSARAT